MLQGHHRPARQAGTEEGWQIEVFYDGECPLCRREIGFLQRMDRRKKIRFTDITSDNFRPADYAVEFEQLMAEIHGRLPDGTWVCGVEVFRRLYAAIGLGPVVWISRLPLIRTILDKGYSVFARNRLRWTGRCSTAGGACRPGQAAEL